MLVGCDKNVASEAPGTVYGEGVQGAPAVRVSELFARMDEFEGKQVRVEGPVTDVCAKRGCWFKMASDKDFQTLTFKVTDGVIVFPMSMKGKYAVAEGVVQKIPLDLERTRRYLAHQAEEQGETFDPAQVTEPITLVRLQGIGAVVRDKK
jgi:hypothetical protein